MNETLRKRITELHSELEKDFVVKKELFVVIQNKIKDEFGVKLAYPMSTISTVLQISNIENKEILSNINLILKANKIIENNNYKKAKEIFNRQDVITNEDSFDKSFLYPLEQVSESLNSCNPDDIIKFLQDFKNKEVGCRGYSRVSYDTDEDIDFIKVSFDKYKLADRENVEYISSGYGTRLGDYLFSVGKTNLNIIKKGEGVIDWAKKIINKYKDFNENSALDTLVKNFDDTQTKVYEISQKEHNKDEDKKTNNKKR